jgi:hypothetical protein
METSPLSGFDVARLPGHYTSTLWRDASFDLETILPSLFDTDSQFNDVSSTSDYVTLYGQISK